MALVHTLVALVHARACTCVQLVYTLVHAFVQSLQLVLALRFAFMHVLVDALVSVLVRL